MENVIVYTQADGVVAVCIPALEDRREGETEEQHFERAAKRAIPADAQHVRTISRDELPKSRSWRDAWTHDGKTISVDMPRAREILRNKMRKQRAKMLRKLDQEQLMGIVQGRDADVKQMEAVKQTLRDVTEDPSIEAAQTPEELDKVWPLPDLPKDKASA